MKLFRYFLVTINFLFTLIFYNWVPTWNAAQKAVMSKIALEPSWNNFRSVFGAIAINPFSSNVPKHLNVPGVNWKSSWMIGFKILNSISILISLLLYFVVVGVFLWGPVRLTLTSGLIGLISVAYLNDLSLFLKTTIDFFLSVGKDLISFLWDTDASLPKGGSSWSSGKDADWSRINAYQKALREAGVNTQYSSPIEKISQVKELLFPPDQLYSSWSLSDNLGFYSILFLSAGAIFGLGYAFTHPGFLSSFVLDQAIPGLKWTVLQLYTGAYTSVSYVSDFCQYLWNSIPFHPNPTLPGGDVTPTAITPSTNPVVPNDGITALATSAMRALDETRPNLQNFRPAVPRLRFSVQ